MFQESAARARYAAVRQNRLCSPLFIYASVSVSGLTQPAIKLTANPDRATRNLCLKVSIPQ